MGQVWDKESALYIAWPSERFKVEKHGIWLSWFIIGKCTGNADKVLYVELKSMPEQLLPQVQRQGVHAYVFVCAWVSVCVNAERQGGINTSAITPPQALASSKEECQKVKRKPHQSNWDHSTNRHLLIGKTTETKKHICTCSSILIRGKEFCNIVLYEENNW